MIGNIYYGLEFQDVLSVYCSFELKPLLWSIVSRYIWKNWTELFMHFDVWITDLQHMHFLEHFLQSKNPAHVLVLPCSCM